MNFLKHACLLIVASVSLASCAESNSRPTRVEQIQNQSPREVRTEGVTINGERPFDFYKHFFFLDTESCNKVWYTMALTDSVLVGIDDLGRDLMASMSIMILQNNTYYVAYDEVAVTERFPGGFRGVPVVKRQARGLWKFDREKIQLEGVGMLTGLMLNGKKALQIIYARDFATPGLKGQTTFAGRVHSTHVDVLELNRCKK